MGMSSGGGGDWRDDDLAVGTVLSEINVTPFVDVMLVLLVIFMVTAPLMTQGVQVNLPRVSTANLEQQDEQPVILTVTAAGQCHVLEIEFGCTELAGKLPAIYEKRTDKSLFIRGDVDTPYGKLMEVLAGAKDAGIISVGLVTEPGRADEDAGG